MDCEGYRKLLAAVEADELKSPNGHNYRKTLHFAVSRAIHYAEKTGLTAEAILDAWERDRDYWYMNYYQDANQRKIEGDNVRVFETLAEFLGAITKAGFRCPACGGVSKSPYECDSGVKLKDKVCDWKVYGLFKDLGKGITVFVKEKVAMELIFMPIAWEKTEPPKTNE
jgi:hypothetical protein